MLNQKLDKKYIQLKLKKQIKTKIDWRREKKKKIVVDFSYQGGSERREI